MKEGVSISDCIYLCKNLKDGFNYVCVSSAGLFQEQTSNLKRISSTFSKIIKEKELK